MWPNNRESLKKRKRGPEKKEWSRTEWPDEREKHKKELMDMEEAFKMAQINNKKGFQRILLTLPDQWEARADKWAKIERKIEENEGRFKRELSY